MGREGGAIFLFDSAMAAEASFEPSPTTFDRGPTVRVVIACTFDPLGLQGPLHVWLRRLTGLRCELSWVGYGMVLDALRDPSSAWGANDAGVNVLLLRHDDLLRAQIAASDLVNALRASCALRRGTTLALVPPTSNDADESSSAALEQSLQSIRGLRFIGREALRVALGSLRRYHSAFLDRVGHAPYSPDGCSVLAGRICRCIARTISPKRKCYLLDCDNTLWGGAVGELGPHGVEMSEAFLAVQRRFVMRQSRGALLCLVSRNEEADVRSVLRERYNEMILHEEHVVAIRAGWGRKSEYVLELARTLCLDPASFLFVDDSPAECDDVSTNAFPKGVGVVHVPRDPLCIEAYFECCWSLDDDDESTTSGSSAEQAAAVESTTTEEDRKRTALYRELDERKHFAAAATSAAASSSVDAFVASLNMRVDISPINQESASRAAQLTERTNQHNACKWVITAERLMNATVGRTCLTVDASDRFGHHGLIGIIVADERPRFARSVGIDDNDKDDGEDDDTADRDGIPAGPVVLHIRCWLLSCRSLHLGIEHMMLRHAASIAKERGASHLGVHWLKAERNEPAAAFLFSLPGVSFVPIEEHHTLGLRPLDERASGPSSIQQHLQHGEVAMKKEPEAAPAANGNGAEAAALAPLTLTDDDQSANATAIESFVKSLIESGRRLILSDLPDAEALKARLDPTERKLLARRLGSLAAKARNGEWGNASYRAEAALIIRGRIGGELCRHSIAGLVCEKRDKCPFVHRSVNGGGDAIAAATTIISPKEAEKPETAAAAAPAAPVKRKEIDSTYGQVSQYKKETIRPDGGVILIPIEAAAAAAVSFTPLSSTTPSSTQNGNTAVEEVASAERRGFASKSSLSLHPETVHTIAEALSAEDGGRALHEWVAKESDKTHKLPEAFSEVWSMYEQRGAQFESELTDLTETAENGEDKEKKGDDVEALGARLRRMMRHSMHVMIQEANPESYYASVTHLRPT